MTVIEACAIGRSLKRSDKPHPQLDRLDLTTPCDHPISKKILLTETGEGPESGDLLLLCECHFRLIYEVTLNP